MWSSFDPLSIYFPLPQSDSRLLPYAETSKALINAPPQGTLKKIRANGDVILYNPSNNTFVISNAEGLPKTAYKPSVDRHRYATNLEYFNAQK